MNSSNDLAFQLAEAAINGEAKALVRLELLAQEQNKKIQQDRSDIQQLLFNRQYMFERNLVGKDPLDGYGILTECTNEYENAYLQLSRYYQAKEDFDKALYYRHMAYQATGFIGDASLGNELKDFIEKQYTELTRRVSKELLQIKNKDWIEFIPMLLKRLNLFLWKTDFDQLFYVFPTASEDYQTDKKLPPPFCQIALIAVEKGMISCLQFATLSRLYALKDKHNITTTPMFLTSGEINPVAKKMVEQTLALCKVTNDPFSIHYSKKINVIRDHKFLDEEELNLVFDKMQNALPSEKIIFSFPYTTDYSKLDANDSRLPISDFISYYGGFNLLCFSDSRTRLLPPSTLERVCLQVKYKEDAVIPNLVIGESSIQDNYRQAFKQMRDQMLPFPGISTPLKADGRACLLADDMSRHDYFHAMAASEVGSHYKLFLGLYMRFKKLTATPEVRALRNFLVDMDFPQYRNTYVNIPGWIKHDKHADRGERFWFAFTSTIEASFKSNSEDLDAVIEASIIYFKEKKEVFESLGVTQEKLFLAMQHVKYSLEKQNCPKELRNGWTIEQHPGFLLCEKIQFDCVQEKSVIELK